MYSNIKKVFISLIAIMMVFTSVDTSAFAYTGDITVTVKDSDGNPVNGDVTLYDGEDEIETGTTTDGKFTFTKQAEDGTTYSIAIADLDGYKPADKVDVVDGEATITLEAVATPKEYKLNLDYDNTKGDVSVKIDGNEATDFTFDKATDAVITVTPKEGYKVAKVVINGISQTISENYPISLDDSNSDISFSVAFENAKKYTLTWSTNNPQFGPQSGVVKVIYNNKEYGDVTAKENKQVFYEGSELTIEFWPYTGFNIASIKLNDVDLENNLVSNNDGNSAYYTLPLSITKDTKISAEFMKAEDKTISNYLTINTTEAIEKDVNGKKIYFFSENSKPVLSLSNVIKGVVCKTLKIGGKEFEFENNKLEFKSKQTLTFPMVLVVNDGSLWDKSITITNNESIELVIDTTAPSISGVNNQYYSNPNSGINISFKVTDTESGIGSLKYEAVNDDNNQYKVSGSPEAKENDTYEVTLTNGNLQKLGDNYTLTITATDMVGNETTKDVKFVSDNTAPSITNLELSSSSNIAYGNDFTGSSSDITLKVSIQEQGSGVESVVLKGKGESNQVFELKAKDEGNSHYAFILSQDKFGSPQEIFIEVKDKVGNALTIRPSDVSPDIIKSNVFFISDNEAISENGFVYTGFTIVKDENNVTQYWIDNVKDKSISFTVYSETAISEVNVQLNGNTLTQKEHYNVDIDKISVPFPWGTYELVKEESIFVSLSKIPEEYIHANNILSIDWKLINGTSGNSTTTFNVFSDYEVTKFELDLNDKGFGWFKNQNATIKVYTDKLPSPEDTDKTYKFELYSVERSNNTIEYKIVNSLDAMYDLDTNQYFVEFVVPKDAITNEQKVYFNRDIAVRIADNEKNSGELFSPSTIDSNLSDFVMIENVNPTVSVTKDNPIYVNEGKEWYKGNTKLSFDVADEDSGICEVIGKINEQVALKSCFVSKFNKKTEDLNTDGYETNTDYSYVIDLKVTDNAGNCLEIDPITIYRDDISPEITSFMIDNVDVEYSDDVEITEYGYFFNKAANVTITADDRNGSGVKEITYLLVDANGNEIKKETMPVNNNSISFNVDQDFKGNILAYATDNVGNDGCQYSPDGTVVEFKDHHDKEVNHITFEYDKVPNSLYNQDVDVKLTIKDEYAGIAEASYKVVSQFDDKNESDLVTADNDGNLSSSEWTVESTDKNLISQISKVVTLSNDSNDIVLEVTMTDNSGNTTTDSITLSIDKTLPTIELTYDNNNPDETYNTVYNEDRKATIKITDRNFNESGVVCTIENTENNIPNVVGWQEYKDETDPNNTYYIGTIDYVADGDYTFTISYKDMANNPSNTVEDMFTIDKTIPELGLVYDNNEADKQYVSFYKENRTATIAVKEHNFAPERMEVIGEGEVNGTAVTFPELSAWKDEGDKHFATLNFTEDGTYKLDLELKDQAGNSIDDFAQQEFTIDKTNPVVNVTYEYDTTNVNYYMREDGIPSYSGKVTAIIEVDELNFDENRVTITGSRDDNGEISDLPVLSQWTHDGTIHTATIDFEDDGLSNFIIDIEDKVGNHNVDFEEQKLIVDKTSPIIRNFEIQGNYADVVEETEYGYWFKQKTTVIVQAIDVDAKNYEAIDTVSGVKSITYTLKDQNGEESTHTVDVDEKNTVTFEVEKNFKGDIIAYATDNVINKSPRVYTPNSTIVEWPEHHETEELDHITFDYERVENDLYNHDVDVKVTIKDEYSGISEVSYKVISPYDDKAEKDFVKVSYNGTLSSDEWTIEAYDKNIVNKMSKVVTLSNDSNNIVLEVTMTDNSNNSTTSQIELSIDKTNPVIELSYDNNTPDETYNTIYKADRQAIVKITERNFDPADVVYSINNTDGVIPSLIGWTEYWNKEDPNKSYYEATIDYVADGDYTFEVGFTDLAANKAESVSDAFTIDKTIPVVSVSYNNNSAQNGNYYNAYRTATIRIDEHNFDANRVRIIGTATDNGATVSFPGLSNWSDNGDVHTATISYNKDAFYKFDIEFIDMAGNSIQDFAEQQFYVDTTKPVVQIGNVTESTAYPAEIAPTVSFSDTNYDGNRVSVSVVSWHRGEIGFNGSRYGQANGEVFAFANLENLKENDDIYTITATITDKAGNSATQSITYSVNRFGSTYMMSESLKEILEKKYIVENKDIVFSEINVNEVSDVIVKISTNGQIKEITEGKDYTVVHQTDNGWHRYLYTIDSSVFANDAFYQVIVTSKDVAGHVNENIIESKESDIVFAVDKTLPSISIGDVEDGGIYNTNAKNIPLIIEDNIAISHFEVYINGELVLTEKDKFETSVVMEESNSKQEIKVVAYDMAGNTYEREIKNITVSTNFFVRWYMNKPLFIGSIGVVAGSLFFILGKKKKKEEEETPVQ